MEAGLRLMIRAARGESIDEPSDLDKKLALLKKQILTNDNIIEKSLTLEVQSTLFDELLNNWINNLTVQTNRFDDFFLEKSFSGGVFYNGNKNPVIKENSTFIQVRDTIRRGINKSAVISHTITFSVAWTGFRQRRKSFDLRLLIDIILLEHEFGVALTINELEDNNFVYSEPEKGVMIFDSIYASEYSLTDYENINYEISGKVYEFIFSKVSEINDLPF